MKLVQTLDMYYRHPQHVRHGRGALNADLYPDPQQSSLWVTGLPEQVGLL